jgi:ABC-type multidrug transport system fused ATPase/permease subunit
VFYIILGVVSTLTCYVANVTWNTAAERQIRRIRNLLFKSIIRQEMAFFDKTTPGDMNSKITRYLIKFNLIYKFT